MKPIEQTKQFLIAIASLVKGALDARANDGKISTVEAGLLIASNTGKVFAAVAGISEIPGELNDLSTEELDELRYFVMLEIGLTITGETEALFEKYYQLFSKAVEVVQFHRNIISPPKPEVIAE